MSASRILISANPKSGAGPSGERVAQLHRTLESRGYASEIVTSLEQVRRVVADPDETSRIRAVISAGGDGTAQLLANLLPPRLPLLLFPLGTENLLAKHLGLTGDIPATCDAIDAMQLSSLDVGEANGKLFLVMLSIGFDAEVVRQMTKIRTGHINRWSYTRPILGALAAYRFPQLRFEITAPQAHSGMAAWLFVFNVPRYAAALNFCPQADPTDGLLDVCTFSRSGVLHGLGYLSRLWMGTHQAMTGFQHLRCSQINIPIAPHQTSSERLPAPDSDIPFQVDGDPGGILPLDIRVIPERLTVVVPPT